MRKNRTSYWPFSHSLSLSGTFHEKQTNFHEITFKLFFFSRRLATTKRFSPLQNMCRFKWAQFHFRLASSSNNTISIKLSLSSSTSLFSSFFFLFLFNVFYFHFPKLVLFFYVFGFYNNFIMSFYSPFSQDNRSMNISRFCLW